jgi:undecaprenyl pyrophosphate phosphatase UppP
MLVVIAVCALVNLLLYAGALVRGAAAPWMPWVFAGSTVVMLSALMLLGARRRDRSQRRAQAAVATVAAILLVGFFHALSAPGVRAGAPLVLGLPLASAIIVYGVGLLPLMVLPLVYALTFDRTILSAEDLQRVRRIPPSTVPDRMQDTLR